MMKIESIGRTIGRFLKKLLVVNLIIFVGSAGLNYLLDGSTPGDYGNILMWAGIIIVLFFGLGASGASQLRGREMVNFSITHTQNIDRQLEHQRSLEANRIIQTVQYLLIAAVPIVVGTILQSL
jgi:hypothetical protein